MENLKNKFFDKKAVIIMGGPSLAQNISKLNLINRKQYVIFLESKDQTGYFFITELNNLESEILSK